MKEIVKSAVLDYLTNVDSPLTDVNNHILERGITKNTALVGEVVSDLLAEGTLVISGIYPHKILSGGLDVHVRKASDFQNAPRSAC